MTEGWVAKRNKLVEEMQAAKAKARAEEQAKKLAGKLAGGESEDTQAGNEAVEDPGFEQWLNDGGRDIEITQDDFEALISRKPLQPPMRDQYVQAELSPEQQELLTRLNSGQFEPVVDEVNHPPHYKSPASCSRCGHEIQCIDVTRHMNFSLGNAVKYIWRVAFGGKRGQDPVKDLEKSSWYVRDEIDARVIQEIED